MFTPFWRVARGTSTSPAFSRPHRARGARMLVCTTRERSEAIPAPDKFYSCSPSGLRPDANANNAGFFSAAVYVATVIAAADIRATCPTILMAKNV